MSRTEPLTLEQIDALPLPMEILGERPRVTPGDYYPWNQNQTSNVDSWDEGKIASYALKDLPRWTHEAVCRWSFDGLGDNIKGEELHVAYGFKHSGRIVLRPKEGDLQSNLARISPLLRSPCVSHEQKFATCQLLFYRLFDVVSQTDPEQAVWEDGVLRNGPTT